MTKQYYVYILTNERHAVFYTGVTNDLVRRVWEHKMKLVEGFTKKYNLSKLVYFEVTENVNAAIWREKLIKKWRRDIKYEAIEKMNSDWKDLYHVIASDQQTVTPSHDGVLDAVIKTA